MSERLTWQEIVEKYPDQWVALDDIIIGDGCSLESAVVIEGIKDEDYFSRQEQHYAEGHDYTYVRTRDNLHNFVGVTL